MLTKGDLQAIKEVIDERLDIKLEDKLNAAFDEKLGPIKKDVQIIRKSLKKVEKTVDVLARSLDREDMQLRKRVDRIETKIGVTTQ